MSKLIVYEATIEVVTYAHHRTSTDSAEYETVEDKKTIKKVVAAKNEIIAATGMRETYGNENSKVVLEPIAELDNIFRLQNTPCKE